MQMSPINNENAVEPNTIEMSNKLTKTPFNETLIHQLLTAYLARKRQGTKAQKSRSEVRGGGQKPWRQKGTGRARAGTNTSPIWVGGGRAFAAKPRDYTQKVNRKMYRSAIRSVLAELLRQNRFIAIENLSLDTPKTRDFVAELKKLQINNALIIVEELNDNLILASRNVPNILLSDISEINLYTLLAFKSVVITHQALKQLEEKYL